MKNVTLYKFFCHKIRAFIKTRASKNNSNFYPKKVSTNLIMIFEDNCTNQYLGRNVCNMTYLSVTQEKIM